LPRRDEHPDNINAIAAIITPTPDAALIGIDKTDTTTEVTPINLNSFSGKDGFSKFLWPMHEKN